MFQSYFRHGLKWLLPIALLSGMISFKSGVSANATAQNPPQAPVSNSLYIPLMFTSYPWISAAGFEPSINLTFDPQLLQRGVYLKAGWVRLNDRVSWRALQPDESLPVQWSLLAGFENELRELNRIGLQPIVIVDDYPRWATIAPNACSPIRSDKFASFAQFLAQLVSRYKGGEFNVHNWELGNEPDVDPSLVVVDSMYGCWGDIADPFYGGRYYGEMLKSVAPSIREADQTARIWIGGLLLDSPNTIDPLKGKPELFLQGILEAGASSSFDIVPYHWYPTFGNVYQKVDFDNANPGNLWLETGGGTVGKARYLRQTMQAYGVYKPVFLDETALGCPSYNPQCSSPPDLFYQLQADFVARSFTRGLAENVSGFIWFTLNGPGWRYTGLLNGDKSVRPNYIAYQQFSAQLHNAEYLAPVDYGSGIEAYAFQRGGEQIHVIWAINGADILTISVPQVSFIAAYTRDGYAISPEPVGTDYLFTVEFSPIYIIRNP